MKIWTFLVSTVVGLTFAVSVGAFTKQPFTQSLFDQLANTDEVVLIDVYATWCPTCAKQQKIIDAYAKQNPDKPFHVLIVDYDENKNMVDAFRAPRQSTLLIFKQGKQFWYSVAETRREVIFAELDKALKFKPKTRP